jgi:hypothetical protein
MVKPVNHQCDPSVGLRRRCALDRVQNGSWIGCKPRTLLGNKAWLEIRQPREQASKHALSYRARLALDVGNSQIAVVLSDEPSRIRECVEHVVAHPGFSVARRPDDQQRLARIRRLRRAFHDLLESLVSSNLTRHVHGMCPGHCPEVAL